MPPTHFAISPASCDGIVDVFLPAGADEDALDAVTGANRDEHRRRNRLDHLVGFFRPPIESAAPFASRADDGEVVLISGRLGQDLANRLAGAHDDLGRDVLLPEHVRFAFKGASEGLVLRRILGDPEQRRLRVAGARNQSAKPRRIIRGVRAVTANKDAHLTIKVCAR